MHASPQDKEANTQFDYPGPIMPFVDRFNSLLSGRPREKESRSDIAKKGDQNPGQKEEGPSPRTRSIKLAQKKRDHDAGLERSDATTGFIDSQEAGLYLNQVSVLQRRNMRKV
jgi:hypothetical protein